MTPWTATLAGLGLLGAVAGAPAGKGLPVYLNVTGWSPLMADTRYWDFDEATGAITSNNVTWNGPRSVDGTRDVLRVLGTRYEPYGTVQDFAPGTERDAGSFSYIYERGGETLGVGAELLSPAELGKLADPPDVQLGSYNIRIRPMANTSVTINYAVIEVPIFTDA